MNKADGNDTSKTVRKNLRSRRSKFTETPIIHNFNTRLNKARQENLIHCIQLENVSLKLSNSPNIKQTETKLLNGPSKHLVNPLSLESKSVHSNLNVSLQLKSDQIDIIQQNLEKGCKISLALNSHVPYLFLRPETILPNVIESNQHVLTTPALKIPSDKVIDQLQDLSLDQNDPKLNISLLKDLLTAQFPEIEFPKIVNFQSLSSHYGEEQALLCVRGQGASQNSSEKPLTSTPIINDQRESSKSNISTLVPWQEKIENWDFVLEIDSANSVISVDSDNSLEFDNHPATISLTSPNFSLIHSLTASISGLSTDTESVTSDISDQLSISNSNISGSNQSINNPIMANITAPQENYTTFSGDLNESHNLWLKGFMSWCQAAALTENQRLRKFPTLLKKNALAKYYTWPDNVKNDWDELERTFLEYWGSPERCSIWAMELSNLKMKSTDKIDDFIQKIVDLGNRLSLDEVQIRSHLINNLTPSLKMAMLTGGTNGLSETIQKLLILDRAMLTENGVGEASPVFAINPSNPITPSIENNASNSASIDSLNKTIGGIIDTINSKDIEMKSQLKSLEGKLCDMERKKQIAALVQNEIECTYCLLKGHLTPDCQRLQAGLPAVNDQNMVMQVHSTPQQPPQNYNGASNQSFQSNNCYICQSPDHWARNCPQNRGFRGGRGRGRGGRGRGRGRSFPPGGQGNYYNDSGNYSGNYYGNSQGYNNQGSYSNQGGFQGGYNNQGGYHNNGGYQQNYTQPQPQSLMSAPQATPIHPQNVGINPPQYFTLTPVTQPSDAKN